jgi:glycine cleavage system aminomethyltransferase T
MRSRGALARTLVGLKLTSSAGVQPGAELRAGDAVAGRLTSICESHAIGGTIALGYVKTVHAIVGARLQVDAATPVDAEVVALAFRK